MTRLQLQLRRFWQLKNLTLQKYPLDKIKIESEREKEKEKKETAQKKRRTAMMQYSNLISAWLLHELLLYYAGINNNTYRIHMSAKSQEEKFGLGGNYLLVLKLL